MGPYPSRGHVGFVGEHAPLRQTCRDGTGLVGDGGVVATRVGDRRDRVPVHVGHHGHDTEQLADQVGDRLCVAGPEELDETVGLVRVVARTGRGRRPVDADRETELSGDTVGREAPLPTDLDTGETSVLGHAIHGGPIDVDQVLDLLAREEGVHAGAVRAYSCTLRLQRMPEPGPNGPMHGCQPTRRRLWGSDHDSGGHDRFRRVLVSLLWKRTRRRQVSCPLDHTGYEALRPELCRRGPARSRL